MHVHTLETNFTQIDPPGMVRIVYITFIHTPENKVIAQCEYAFAKFCDFLLYYGNRVDYQGNLLDWWKLPG